jgi:hypothetical protein
MGLENIARKILIREGVGAIWQLHLAAARAYRDGQKAAATGIIEIADVAEREWLRGDGHAGSLRLWWWKLNTSKSPYFRSA